MLEIEFYRTSGGACPVEEFLDALNAKEAKKVLWVLKVVQELPQVPGQYFKKLEGTADLWEVRANYGGNAFRLLGFREAGRRVILTNGFAKKTQKTPEREMELAEQRKRDHLNRREAK
jgi:phage-related protein